MKKYKVLKDFIPVHGLVIEAGSVIQLGAQRESSLRGKKIISEIKKNTNKKIDKDGNNSSTD